MAIAIRFKKVNALPSSPVDTSFYFVNDKDLYLGNRKLNNEDDLSALVARVETIEGIIPGIATEASDIIVNDKDGLIDANNVEDALAELARKIGAAGGAFEDFSLLRITPDDWTGYVREGGRYWNTATFNVTEVNGNIIHAIPCGGTLDVMPTLEEEQLVYGMKAYIDLDDNKATFYSPVIPEISVVLAISQVAF